MLYFLSDAETRCILSRKDFVKYHLDFVDRIQDIFVHELLSEKRHLFAMIESVVEEHDRDSI